jgi:hypothetical protein
VDAQKGVKEELEGKSSYMKQVFPKKRQKKTKTGRVRNNYFY